MSRRQVLKAGVAGAMVLAGGWLTYVRHVWPFSAPVRPSPRATYPWQFHAYESRPDLWSPVIAVTPPAANAAPGQTLLTPAQAPGPVMVDLAGQATWIHPAPGKRAFNLRVSNYRGAPVLSWFEGDLDLGTGRGEYVMVDQSYREVARVRAGNGRQGDLHEYITTPEGTALFSIYSQRPGPGASPGSVDTSPTPRATPTGKPAGSPAASPGSNVLDSLIQEVDIETGSVLFEWRAADHIGLDESYVQPSAGQNFDFFHINSIDVDTDGNLLISARHTCAIYKVDRHTGDVIWRLGGRRSDFALDGDAKFAWQHDARRQPDGTITLFDDESNGQGQSTLGESRGMVLAVDEANHHVSLVRSFRHPGGVLAKSQGSMQPLPNGNVLVGWGDQPYYTEFGPDGSVVSDGRLPDKATSYRALRYQWVGRPVEPPAIAAEPSGSSTLVYVSWNGATEVSSWAVVGGDSPGTMAPLARQPRWGFETLIVLPGHPRLVAAEALDASGKVIGRSPTVPV